MAIINDNKILTLSFERLGAVQMHYHPASLNISEQSPHQNVNTLDGKVSFISPWNTHQRNISITSYFTALEPKQDFDNAAGILGTFAVGTALSIGSQISPDFVEKLNQLRQAAGQLVSVYSLAKSVINLASGEINPLGRFSPPVGNLRTATEKIETLIKASRQGDRCRLNWDLENSTSLTNTDYILSSISLDMKRLKEESGQTLEFECKLQLMDAGKVIIENG